MDLTIYDIILGPVISDKAYKLNKSLKKLFLRVHADANKKLVQNALEKLFNVKVKDVNIQNRKGKTRVVRRKTFNRSDEKRAIVTLAEGYSLDLFEQVRTDVPAKEATKG
jgi:large subunit ribosomal protein L23